MKPLLHAELINSPFGDPALFIEVLWEHRALIFDLGEVGAFRPAKLLKISHAFISHTHIDHFVGGAYSDGPNEAYWTLISRNSQSITSGLYMFSVESKVTGNTFVGRFVIVK